MPPREILLTIRNAHTETDEGTRYPPEFSPDDDFVAYSENLYGEQMVYVQRKGERVATLYHGDYGWKPVTIKDGIPLGLIVNDGESAFCRACWQNSASWRE